MIYTTHKGRMNMVYILIAIASFFYVGFKGFQNLSAVFKKWKWVPALSYCISFCEVFIIASVASYAETFLQGVWLAVSLGTGGWMGFLTSMWLHPKLTGKHYGEKDDG